MMDLSQICRTCLGSQNLTPIFEKVTESESYYFSLRTATGLKILKDDGLPQQLCDACSKFIKLVIEFRKQCKIAETKLHNIVTSIPGAYKQNIITNNKLKEANIKLNSEEDQTVKSKLTESFNIKIEEVHSVDNKNNVLDSNMGQVNIKLEQDTHTEIRIEENLHGPEVSEYDMSDKEELELKPIKAEISIENTTLQNIQKAHPVEIELQIVDTSIVKEETSEQAKTDLGRKKEENIKQIEQNNKVTCKICQKRLARSSMSAHMGRVHGPEDENRRKCELCDKSFMKQRIQYHKNKAHGQNLCRCLYCHKEQASTEDLIRHVAQCPARMIQRERWKKYPNPLVQCDVCKQRLHKTSMRAHMNLRHGVGIRPVCDHCGQEFSNKVVLTNHLRSRHGLDKLRCRRCHFQTTSALSLQNHHRTHLNEKPFVCEQCGARFTARALLIQHSYSHRATKDMKCDLCPAAFKSTQALNMHKRNTHNHQRFQCDQCDCHYKARHYLNRHIRRSHPPLPPPPADTRPPLTNKARTHDGIPT